jgi:hypothetical protein
LAIFFLFPSKKLFKIQLLEISPQQQKEQRQKQLDISFFWCLLVKETAEKETGLAKKSSRGLANIGQNLGLVWRNRKKISQIIKDCFFLPFFLLIILWSTVLLLGL